MRGDSAPLSGVFRDTTPQLSRPSGLYLLSVSGSWPAFQTYTPFDIQQPIDSSRPLRRHKTLAGNVFHLHQVWLQSSRQNQPHPGLQGLPAITRIGHSPLRRASTPVLELSSSLDCSAGCFPEPLPPFPTGPPGYSDIDSSAAEAASGLSRPGSSLRKITSRYVRFGTVVDLHDLFPFQPQGLEPALLDLRLFVAPLSFFPFPFSLGAHLLPIRLRQRLGPLDEARMGIHQVKFHARFASGQNELWKNPSPRRRTVENPPL